MIKAAFFDIDGTLFSHKSHRVPPSAVYAINELKKKGIINVLCTGRYVEEVKKVDLAGLEFDYEITLNGQMIKDKNGVTVKAFPFIEEDIKALKEIFNEKRFSILLIEEDDIYFNIVTEDAVKANKSFSLDVPKTGEYSCRPIYQIMSYGTKDDVYYITERINANAVWWNELSADIIPKDGGKDKGIEALIEMLGIKRDEIITFGDGNNDIPMLRMTPYSVAMGNADDSVKEAASYTTSDIDEDGILNALKHFKIL